MRSDPTEPVYVDGDSVVRPWNWTQGRLRPSRDFNLGALVFAGDAPASYAPRLSEMHRRLYAFCQEPRAVAEAAHHLDLPLLDTRILLSDLVDVELVAVVEPQDHSRDVVLLGRVLNGLRELH